MNQKFEICGQCFLPKPVNSKGLCPECVFKNNHNGLSQQEVYQQRSEKKKQYVNSLPNTTKETRKTMLNNMLKDERLEKRREILRKDEEFYELIFNMTEPICEECGRQLPDQFRDSEGNILYRAQYSHILTKGAHQEFRHDIRNINRLCHTCHDIWEFGDRVEMKIYPKNQETVQILNNEKNKV